MTSTVEGNTLHFPAPQAHFRHEAYITSLLQCIYIVVLSTQLDFTLSRRDLLHYSLASSLDKTDGQVSRVGGHFFLQRDQLINIPLRPHKSTVEEFCLWAGKPDRKVARQFPYKKCIVSIDIISTGSDLENDNLPSSQTARSSKPLSLTSCVITAPG